MLITTGGSIAILDRICGLESEIAALTASLAAQSPASAAPTAPTAMADRLTRVETDLAALKTLLAARWLEVCDRLTAVEYVVTEELLLNLTTPAEALSETDNTPTV